MLKIKNNMRRAFTIVELVIVIVVIAALAAVLVPTFVNVINAANESNDTVLAKNLDTSLVTIESKLTKVDIGADDDVYNVTEAITLVRNDGYDVSKLSPTADYADYVYNATTNRFLYYTENFTSLAYGEEPAEGDVLVVMTNSTLDRYGIAEESDALGALITSGDITLQYCVYSTESTVTVETDENVTIWVYSENNATVTINAASSTIWQDGDCYYVTVTCSQKSYHPLGTVNFVEMLKGRYVPELQGNVSYVYFLSASYSSGTVIFDDFSAEIKTIVLTDSNSVTAGGKNALNVNDSSVLAEYNDDFILSETIITEATCTQKGEATYTTVLGTTGTRTIDKLDHSYGTDTEKDYVEDDGVVYINGVIQICSVCKGFKVINVGEEDTSNAWSYTGTTLTEWYPINDDVSQDSNGRWTYNKGELEVPYGTTALGTASTEGPFSVDVSSSYLTSIELPDTLTFIGKLAFYNQLYITLIEIPSNVTTIGDDDFN